MENMKQYIEEAEASLLHTYNRYQVVLDKELQQEDFDKMLAGIELDDGEIKADSLNYIDEEDKKKVQCGREIVCRVDFSHFFARKEAVKKAVELKRNMEQRIREAQELALYEALAEKDPTLKSMLDEYRTLMEACK